MADNCHGTRWTSQQPVREINSCNNSALRTMYCVHSLSEQLDFSLPEHLTTTTCWLITWITADWSHNWSQLIMSGAMITWLVGWITWLVGWITWLVGWITWHKLLHELLLTDHNWLCDTYQEFWRAILSILGRLFFSNLAQVPDVKPTVCPTGR